MNWETYLALGDSITIGARSYLGYPELVGYNLASTLNKEWHVINHAVSGYTCIDLIRYVDAHFDRLINSKPEFCSLLIGTNDCKIGTSEKDFEIAYHQLLVKLKLIHPGNNILIVKIPQFHEGIMLPYKIEMNSTIQSYNQIITKLATQFNLDTIELNLHKKHFFDGVHLNDEGNEHTAKVISDCVLNQRGF